MAKPRGLGPKSSRLWRSLTTDYELRPDELRVLEDACREIDLIDRMEDELGTGDLLVPGSMGQPVVSPLVQELRQHRSVLQRLLGSLKLPEAASTGAGGAEKTRAVSAREAAMARWGRGA